MAKRGRTERDRGDSQSRVPAEATGRKSFLAANQTRILVGFLVCLAGYLALFYSAPLTKLASPEPLRRWEFQQMVVQYWPFYLELWSGGDWSQCDLTDRLPVVLLTGLIVGFGWTVGQIALNLIGATRQLSRLESFVFATGVGLSVLSLFTLAIGLAGGLQSRIVKPAVLVAIAMAAIVLQRTYSKREPKALASGDAGNDADQPQPAASAVGSQESDWPATALLCIVPFALVILLGSMLPPRAFDVREYHLQVPKEWYQNGQIDFMPHNIYGNMPLGAEMHSLLAMTIMDDWWWGAIVGKTVMGLFAPLTALALFAMGRRIAGTMAGVVAALVYISIPWTALVSMHGLNEGVFGFYFLTAVYAMWLWTHDESASNLILSGFLAGSAVACKYPALLFVVIPLLCFVAVRSVKERTFAEQKATIWFSLAVICGCGLWLGKNWILTGNPTYPLLSSIFGGHTLTPDKLAQWHSAHAIPGYSLQQLAESFSLVLWSSDLNSPVLYPLAILALFVRRHVRVVLLLVALYLFVIASWWLVTHRLDRFWVPVLPLVALLAGIGVTWLHDQNWRRIVIALLAIGSICNFMMVTSRLMQNEVRFFVALDILREDRPTPNMPVPSRMHPAHQILNRSDDVQGVLMVGDAQPFDLEMPALYNTCFDECVFTRLIADKSASERKRALHKAGISHVLVNWSELERYRSTSYGYSSDYVQPDVFEELISQGVLKRLPIPMTLSSPNQWYKHIYVVLP